jgi:hypothetical protein
MYVTPEEADGTIGFGCDVTGVICPAQVIANGYTKILLSFVTSSIGLP